MDKLGLDRIEDAVDSEDDLAELDLSSGNKDACVLEVNEKVFKGNESERAVHA